MLSSKHKALCENGPESAEAQSKDRRAQSDEAGVDHQREQLGLGGTSPQGRARGDRAEHDGRDRRDHNRGDEDRSDQAQACSRQGYFRPISWMSRTALGVSSASLARGAGPHELVGRKDAGAPQHPLGRGTRDSLQRKSSGLLQRVGPGGSWLHQLGPPSTRPPLLTFHATPSPPVGRKSASIGAASRAARAS